MTIKKETTAFDFLVNDSWDVDQLLIEQITDNGLVDEFNFLADETFPGGCSETELNDWLRFDVDDIRETLGIESDEDD